MIKLAAFLLVSLCLVFPGNTDGQEKEAPAKQPTVEEQINHLTGMCAASDSARTARHAAKPLYERLGGYEKIHAITTEVVRLHNANPALESIMKGVDSELLAKRVADFMAAGTGGKETYEGQDMVTAHEHLKLTDADFLAAGGDVIQAMKNLKCGEDEINEVVCILVSLKDMVVLKDDKAKDGGKH